MTFKKGHISWNEGKTFSEETKKKMSKIRKDKINNGEITIWNKGIKCPKISETRKRLFYEGELIIKPNSGQFRLGHKMPEKLLSMIKLNENQNHNWKGGSEAHYRAKARAIVKNKWKVKLTKDLVVHHIDGNIKNNIDENLVVINREYHTKLHHEQGDIHNKIIGGDYL